MAAIRRTLGLSGKEINKKGCAMRGLFTYLFLSDTFQENINRFDRIFLFLNYFKEGIFVGNLFADFNVVLLVENPTTNSIDGIFI